MLVAVLLSAQCTDVRVNKTTPALFVLADKPEQMAKQSMAAIDAIVRPCGLAPRKATAIRDLSRILVDEHEGRVPESFEELEALPGVGHKTASVVMTQAFGHPAFPVDTHIHRLAQRWGLTNGKSVVRTEIDLKSLLPRKPGIVCTCRSFTTVANIARPVVAMAPSVKFAAPVIRKGVNPW